MSYLAVKSIKRSPRVWWPPSNVTGLWNFPEESQTVPPISRDNDLVPVLTYLTRFRAVAVFTHPLSISRFIPRSLSLRRVYKLHVTSHSKDIEQNGGLEGGTDRRKCKMKGGTRMPQWFYCGFFSRPNVPHCKRKSTMPSCACLIMRVSKQANNYHPVQTDQLTHSHAKKCLPGHFYYLERLCLVYLFTLYTPGP